MFTAVFTADDAKVTRSVAKFHRQLLLSQPPPSSAAAQSRVVER